MSSNKLYLGQESLESVNNDIRAYLNNGSSVKAISQSLLGSNKAILIISKEFGGHPDEFSDDEKIDMFVEYINDNFANELKRSCVSPEIKRIMESNFYGGDLDEYSDYLTELINSDGYQKVNHHITNIMACFKPYMLEKYPDEFKSMSIRELEKALIDFIKEHLVECVAKKPK